MTEFVVGGGLVTVAVVEVSAFAAGGIRVLHQTVIKGGGVHVWNMHSPHPEWLLCSFRGKGCYWMLSFQNTMVCPVSSHL